MSSPAACTIVSNNYLAFARVFARSFLERHPEGRVWVLIVDRPDPSLDYQEEPFEVLFASQLGIPAFQSFAFRYSILELNTAVKPYLLQYLRDEEGLDSVCYFDPDILITGDLSSLYELVARSDIVLIPHVLEPIEDARNPSERDFLLSGIYNLGFLGISFNEATSRMLDWWARRLHRSCVHRVERGLFVDQKWMDFGPAFLDCCTVLRDPGYNVAYWNLMHRRIRREGDGWTVEEVPLRFFHFSGFQSDEPESVSKYQNRYRLSDRPDLEPLFEQYARALCRQGVDDVQELPYRYGYFDNGVFIPAVARHMLQQIDPKGDRWSDPFRTTVADSFFAWLIDPVKGEDGVRIPRLALGLWDLRPDLQRAFADPLGADGASFLSWFGDEVSRSEDLDEVWAEAVPAASQARLRSARRSWSRALDLPLRAGRGLGIRTSQVRWLSADASLDGASRPRIPRLALRIHEQRLDLQAAYPEPLGSSREDFALWYTTHGRLEYALPASLVRPVLRSLPLRRRSWASLWWLKHRRQVRRLDPLDRMESVPTPHRLEEPGRDAALGPGGDLVEESPSSTSPSLNVIGWTTAATGVGEVCRGTLKALETVGICHAVWPLKHPEIETNGLITDGTPPHLPYEVSLFHVNADMMKVVSDALPLSLRSGRYRIGYWFWELSHFPLAQRRAFWEVDEVWAASRFCVDSFSTIAPVPVRWVPPAVELPKPSRPSREELGLPQDRPVFFFAFDALSVPERKNPRALLRAFRRAIEDEQVRAHLLLKVSHATDRPELRETLLAESSGLPVTIFEEVVSRERLLGMLAAVDGYISLHRSEGLGLPLIEAMLLGKPVIATGYGGCTDFLDEETGWPVPYRLVPLERAYGPYPPGAVWAEPDEEATARILSEVCSHPEAAARKAAAARRRIQTVYSPEAAGERIKRELERIDDERRARPR